LSKAFLESQQYARGSQPAQTMTEYHAMMERLFLSSSKKAYQTS